MHANAHSLLEAADTFHKKFIDIGAYDGQKHHALQERRALIRGFRGPGSIALPITSPTGMARSAA